MSQIIDLDPRPASKAYTPREQVIRTPKCGARGQLTTTSNTTAYTAPTITDPPTGSNVATSYLTSLVLCNSDSAARTVSVHLVESGGSVAANRLILSALSIAASTTTIITFGPQGCPLDSGEFVNLVAGTANTISYRVNVEELTF